MIERRATPSPAEQVARGNEIIAKYNRRLLWLAGVTAAVLIGLLLFTLVQVANVAEEAKNQTIAVRQILESEKRGEANRQRLINEAVAKIAAEQYRALVAHDRRTEQILRRNSRLLDQEVNAPSNQEDQAVAVIPVPRSQPAPPTASAPRTAPVGPSTGVGPAPQPAPAPCVQRGKSGKCKKK